MLNSCPLAGSQGEPVELHAIWNRKVANPALGRLLAELDYPDGLRLAHDALQGINAYKNELRQA